MDYQHSLSRLEQPFPLRRIFRRRIAPAVGAILLLMSVLGTLAETSTARDIYINLAQSRAEVLASIFASEAPEEWRILTETPLRVLTEPAISARLKAVLSSSATAARIAKIKVYEPGGRMILGGDANEIGKIEAAPELREALDADQAKAVRTVDENKVPVYEFFVPILGTDGDSLLVFEIYEPAGFLDRILWLNALPAIALPAVLLGALLWWLARLVGRAQSEIDSRTQALSSLRERLERFVSASAKGAARGASDDGAMASRLVDMTLFHSDVVDFTGYSENHPPQRVVDFLNRLMTIQVEELHRFGGDVDKMIGDAVLACFEGADRAERAVAAAQAIQTRLAGETDLPRPLRIGLFDGHVISGAIGPEQRQDFTVIGDTVNVAARLCSHAEPGEVVTDQRTIARAGHPDGFGPPAEITLKGRVQTLKIRRWRPAFTAAAMPAP